MITRGQEISCRTNGRSQGSRPFEGARGHGDTWAWRHGRGEAKLTRGSEAQRRGNTSWHVCQRTWDMLRSRGADGVRHVQHAERSQTPLRGRTARRAVPTRGSYVVTRSRPYLARRSRERLADSGWKRQRDRPRSYAMLPLPKKEARPIGRAPGLEAIPWA